jgi:hypothetical protein
MIINFRYHIFTITAIFAALGLGILIGSSFIGHEGLIEEQKRIINNIGSDIKQLRTENNELKNNLSNLEKELTYHRNLERELIPLVVGNKLTDQQYLLVSTGNNDKGPVKEFSDLLKKAGVNIKIIDQIKKIGEQETGQVIFWNVNSGDQETFLELNEGFSEKPIIYNRTDVAGLILRIVKEVENKVTGDNDEGG